MNKACSLITAAVLGLAALASAPPAQAASETSISSPTCGMVKIKNTATKAGIQEVSADNGAFSVKLGKGQTSVTKNLPAGTYVWHASSARSEAYGRVTVKPCRAGWPQRRTPGDQNGDGRSDVLGIQAGTGALYYYRTTSTGLASGVKAGSGWNNMVWMQQVDDVSVNGRRGNYLFALHRNGTLWRYPNRGQGKFGAGVQVAKGLGGHKSFAVLPANNALFFGAPVLLVGAPDRYLWGVPLYEGKVNEWSALTESWFYEPKAIGVRDFDGDSIADVISIEESGLMQPWLFLTWRQLRDYDDMGNHATIGSGWKAMSLVSSPGSLDGDWNSDLIARRIDGNLYKYLNAGGRWYAGQQIGTRWNQIRLLA
ncbi:hypothetical protein AAEX63_06025 [Luteococcus sp. H138]|uniref:hypothetical protein n=1 Tax=unclassified Luteococcus TaxID=2639923 RepID=UPI00313D847A